MPLLHLPINYGTQAVAVSSSPDGWTPSAATALGDGGPGQVDGAHADLTGSALGEDFAAYFCDPRSASSHRGHTPGLHDPASWPDGSQVAADQSDNLAPASDDSAEDSVAARMPVP